MAGANNFTTVVKPVATGKHANNTRLIKSHRDHVFAGALFQRSNISFQFFGFLCLGLTPYPTH